MGRTLVQLSSDSQSLKNDQSHTANRMWDHWSLRDWLSEERCQILLVPGVPSLRLPRSSFSPQQPSFRVPLPTAFSSQHAARCPLPPPSPPSLPRPPSLPAIPPAQIAPNITTTILYIRVILANDRTNPSPPPSSLPTAGTSRQRDASLSTSGRLSEASIASSLAPGAEHPFSTAPGARELAPIQHPDQQEKPALPCFLLPPSLAIPPAIPPAILSPCNPLSLQSPLHNTTTSFRLVVVLCRGDCSERSCTSVS